MYIITGDTYMLPTINLNDISEYLKTVDFDDFNMYNVVKEWINNNLIEDPPDHYVRTAVTALLDEKII